MILFISMILATNFISYFIKLYCSFKHQIHKTLCVLKHSLSNFMISNSNQILSISLIVKTEFGICLTLFETFTSNVFKLYSSWINFQIKLNQTLWFLKHHICLTTFSQVKGTFWFFNSVQIINTKLWI